MEWKGNETWEVDERVGDNKGGRERGIGRGEIGKGRGGAERVGGQGKGQQLGYDRGWPYADSGHMFILEYT
jgi:hypothetical protein